MKIENIYSKGEVSLLNLVSDYVTEEECSITNMYKAYLKDELLLKVDFIKIDNKKIPIMLLTNVKDSDKDYYIEEVITKLKNKIKWHKKDFDKDTKDIESLKQMSFSDSNYLNGEISTEDFSNLYHKDDRIICYKELFTTVFVGGTEKHCIGICPNWFNTYCTKNELKEVRRTLKFKQNTKLFRNKEILSEVFVRRVKLYNKLEEILNKIIDAYHKDLLCVMGSRNVLSGGLNFITINSVKNKELMKKHKSLVVFNVDRDYISYKSDDTIKLELKDIQILEKEEKNFIKKLDKVKIKLQKANKEWFSLSRVEKHNNIWEVWLNPYNQSTYNYGWFTLEDLLLWVEDKGPIIKNKNK